MKITALEESTDFATLDTEKLLSKLKSHELSRKGHPNHDAFFSSKALITDARVGGHVANPTNTTDSSVLDFALSSLATTSDEQYESIPIMRSPYWRGSSALYTGFTRRGEDHRGIASSAVTPPTSSLTAPSGTSMTSPTSKIITTEMTPAARVRTRRSTTLGIRRKRRSSIR
jgi:hypothetical protein